ncbi:DUF3995 domain-containing protein [Nocardiopsis sp. NPDC058631]|uniref:DUF3995 domain-containing protein n=1 Tax=Nocardiopsis sp. NPDC058631 TaxID=3346566 RepID=UPI003668E310
MARSERGRPRRAVRERLGGARSLAVAAYGAALCSAAYGAMKLTQALGGNALADKDPLPPELRDRLLARDPLFVASHWALAAAALVGVLLALSAVRPWGAALPRRLVPLVAGVLGAFMVLRSVGFSGIGFVGDGLTLAGVRELPAEHAGLIRELALWDLVLWSPFFLLWGVCWSFLAWRTGRAARSPASSRGGGAGLRPG